MKPDLEILTNKAVEAGLNSPKVLAFYNGTVRWFRVGIIKVVTSFDTSNYPFDRQTVQLVMSSMSYTKDMVEVNFEDGGIVIDT